ncbi:MAG: cytochrome C oxidase subunit II [Verrucomicrobia bacterium]|jgi:cytochrome c oxidase subunit II|nr:cytochrome C oxidase subunit II [Verrucomicrobiota bacterium]
MSEDLLRTGDLPEEEISRAENRWVLVVCAITVLIVVTFTVSIAFFRDAPPSSLESISSDEIHRSGEFVESNLGTAMQLDGSAVVRLVLQQFSFSPSVIKVPVNTPVTIRAVSADVVHGFLVIGTNVNAMVVPGYITTVRVQFSHPGEYTVPCHEFCGIGHQDMWAKLIVGSKADFPVDPTGKQRF